MMPLLIPVLSAITGFGAGFWTADKYGWVKWLIIAALLFWMLKVKLGVI